MVNILNVRGTQKENILKQDTNLWDCDRPAEHFDPLQPCPARCVDRGWVSSFQFGQTVGRYARLTWYTSSVATLKVQVLDVDLEILLLSFLMPILWDDM